MPVMNANGRFRGALTRGGVLPRIALPAGPRFGSEPVEYEMSSHRGTWCVVGHTYSTWRA